MAPSSPAPSDRPRLAVAEPKAPPKPPAHLSASSKRWYREVVADYDLQSHHLRLLQAAAEAWDRLQEARAALKRDGTYIADRYGSPKSHPAVSVERDSRIAFARLVRELDLEGEQLPDPRMPRRRG
jgi:P27 family predicted phage terminase small subunit